MSNNGRPSKQNGKLLNGESRLCYSFCRDCRFSSFCGEKQLYTSPITAGYNNGYHNRLKANNRGVLWYDDEIGYYNKPLHRAQSLKWLNAPTNRDKEERATMQVKDGKIVWVKEQTQQEGEIS